MSINNIKIEWLNLFLFFLIFNSCTAQNQLIIEEKQDLMKLIFSQNKSDQIIFSEKATAEISLDSYGWIGRINKDNFGFPEFNASVNNDLYKYHDSLKSLQNDNYLNSNIRDSLILAKKSTLVRNFFSEKDKSCLEKQILSAKPENWDSSKFNIEFSDTNSAVKVSNPYFNKDIDKAIIFIVSPTIERAEFYRKKDGKWEFYFSSLLWIE